MDISNNNESQMSLFEVMLEFVRAAVFERKPVIPQNMTIDWDNLMDVSSEHGLLAWVWDGICKLPADQQPPRLQRINWGLSAQEAWDNYANQKSVLLDLVEKCKQNNIRVLLLKGIGLSEMYPKPQSRHSSDIDIYLFGDLEKGNVVLANDNLEFRGKHFTFEYKGVSIENHENFFYHGTPLQIDVDNYLFSAVSECKMEKDGYYVLPKMAGLIHLLLHSMVHLNNPVEHITIKNIVDFACYLFFNKNELNPKKCYNVMRELKLEQIFDLFLQLSEWILSVDFSKYRKEIKQGSRDLDKAVKLLLDDNLMCPKFDNYSFTKQLKQRITYYLDTRWRYSYLPNWRVVHRGFVRRQIGYFIKSVFKKPFDAPFRQSVFVKTRS